MSVLKSVNGFESFKKINKGELKQSNVLDFMVKLKEFPRSIIFCINRLIAVTKYLPNSENLKLKLIKIKKQAVKLNEKSTDNQILVMLDLFQLGLIDLHLEIEEKNSLIEALYRGFHMISKDKKICTKSLCKEMITIL